jgi:hypothetical protein
VSDLRPEDFAGLKRRLSERNGPHRMGIVIQVIRCAFKHALDAELIDRAVRFGPAFKRPSKKTLRLHRAEQGAKRFAADEIRRLIDTGACADSGSFQVRLGKRVGVRPRPWSLPRRATPSGIPEILATPATATLPTVQKNYQNLFAHPSTPPARRCGP